MSREPSPPSSTLAYAARKGREPSVGDTLASAPPPIDVAATVAAGSRTVSRSTVLPFATVIDSRRTLVIEEKNRYERSRQLGEGGIGLVDEAHDNDIDRKVAVKRLRPEQRDPASLARFVEEIRLVGRLEHPNIVPIHDVGVDGQGDYYFVMKYVEGETLESVIAHLAAGDAAYHRRFPFERRMEIFLGILEAMQYAHGRGILHRDLKPANVMIGPAGEVMVMDWGIACRTDDPSAKGGELAGTPLYMSPEQATSAPLDARSDIYSLCVILHEFLTLKHYLADRTTTPAVLAGVQSEAPPLASFTSNPHQSSVPMELTWYLKAGLNKDPAKRFPSVDAMIDRLRARAEGKFPIQCHVTFIKRVNRETLRFLDRHVWIGTALICGALAGMVWLAIH